MISPPDGLAAGKLLAAGAACRYLKHLATSIGAAVEAYMMRAAGLVTLRADSQLGDLDLVMRTAIGLARVRETSFW
jgi:hypothetical protein